LAVSATKVRAASHSATPVTRIASGTSTLIDDCKPTNRWLRGLLQLCYAETQA